MFFDKVGKMAIGSRLRMLSESVTEDAKSLYELYEVNIRPKWFPVFYVLSEGQDRSITSIAEEIGHSHPSVSKIVREMKKDGIIEEGKDKKDGRKTIVRLTEKGKQVTEKIQDQYKDVDKAIEVALSQTQHNLWKAIEEFEYLLKEKSLFKRVMTEKKIREGQKVNILDYTPAYREAFRDLNEAWISQYFKMEDADRQALNHPKEYILDKGGHIFIALYEGEAVGVCALMKMYNFEYDYELAKMAVSPKAQGLGIGSLLGNAIIEKARSLGAETLYLESNTILKPAINLYQKLGFKKVSGFPTPYERSNIQMVLNLNE